MWKFKNDNTPAIINAKKHIASSHSNKIAKLPKTAILLRAPESECGKGILTDNYRQKQQGIRLANEGVYSGVNRPSEIAHGQHR